VCKTLSNSYDESWTNGLLIIKQKKQASQILIYAEINENLNEKIKNYNNKPGDSILWALPVFGTANRKTISLENKKILYLENNSNNNIIPTKKPSVKQKLRNFGWNDIAQILPDRWTVWKRLQWLTYQVRWSIWPYFKKPFHSPVILCVFEYGQVRWTKPRHKQK